MMSVEDFRVGLHLPEALTSRIQDGDEVAQSLPPYASGSFYNLEDYPGAPESWVRGNGRDEETYFFAVPRQPARGIWFDFRELAYGEHEVAVRVSVQGVDALTGMRSDDQRLHWYRNNCPIHNIPFGRNRFCDQCKYAWPPTNFLSTTGAQRDRVPLWLYGFRHEDGKVRQLIFVDDPSRGVAAQLIGEDRSPAFAFVFYRSVSPKPVDPDPYRSGSAHTRLRGGGTLSKGIGSAVRSMPEVAAGAVINQRVGEDPNGPDFWQDTPAGIIRLYFGWEDEIAKILASRHKPQTGGFLGGLKTGNPPRTNKNLIF